MEDSVFWVEELRFYITSNEIHSILGKVTRYDEASAKESGQPVGPVLTIELQKDKYGVSWQIVPEALDRCLSNPDPIKAQRAMRAMLQMKKIIVADLEKAVAGE